MITTTEEKIARGDVDLVMHRWVPPSARAALFYIHGIQSHGGWLFETGPSLAGKGVATYVLDRRGSGASGGRRGHVASPDVWLDDYVAAMKIVRERHADVPLTLLGQSMGGSMAAGIVADGRAPFDRLVLCAPALNQMHVKLSPEQRRALLDGDPESEQPVALEDTSYTRDPRFLAFMKADPLMLRRVTVGLRAGVLSLEERYMATAGRWPRRPTALVVPRTDPIIRLDAARAAFDRLVVGGGIVTEMPVDDHYLEFSSSREALVSYLAWFSLGAGAGRADA